MMKVSSSSSKAPEFLSVYAGLELDAESASLVALGVDLGILWVNAGWERFAAANRGGDVLERFGKGTSYLDGISGAQREHYEAVLRGALVDDEPHESFYECSTPETFRLLKLRALPFPGRGLLLEHTIVEERPHDRTPEPLDERRFTDSRGLVLQCGNCRRTQDPAARSWHWVASWVDNQPSNTTHGVCAVCLGYYYGERLRKR